MIKNDNENKINFIKESNFCHFKKVNLIGLSNVGKKTLLSYIKSHHNSNKNIESNKDIINLNKDENTKNNNTSLVEVIEKLSITYEETKRLDINLYITNIDNINIIKENIDTLISNSECIIFMINLSSSLSFSSFSELFFIIYNKMKNDLKSGYIPFFFICNKNDLEKESEVNSSQIKELMDKYSNINNFEISLNLEKKESDNNINEFILKLCKTISENDKKYSFVYDYLNLVKIIEPIKISNEIKNKFQNVTNTLSFLFLGSQSVGKSSFIQKFYHNKFLDNTLITLGIDVVKTIGEVNGNLIKIELWDTAGQEKLRSIPKKYYSKADGFFLLFDVTDRRSFEEINGWIKDIRGQRSINEGDNFQKQSIDEVLLLIGNKIDKIENRKVSKEEANNLAKKYNVKYYEMSCKQGINIYEIFCQIIYEASSKNKEEFNNISLTRRKSVVQKIYNPNKKKCC